MKIKNLNYRGLNLSTNAIQNGLLLNDVQFDALARTNIYNNALYHGGTTSKTLANTRLFTIYGSIIGKNSEEMDNAIKFLEKNVPYIGIGNEYFELKFEDYIGGVYKCKAKVYKTPKYENRVNTKGQPVMSFEFELLSDTAEYISYENIIESRIINLSPFWDDFSFWNDFDFWDEEIQNKMTSGGVQLGVELPNELGEIIGLSIYNLGNFDARCKIQITGLAENLKIINHTNGRFYGLTGIVTEDLIIDNTGEKFLVTNNGIDVSSFRDSGSVSIFLSPGLNLITLKAETDLTGLNFKIFYNHTFI